MGHYVMALLYECTATLWIIIELISERGAEHWLTRTDVGQCKVEPPARDAPHNASETLTHHVYCGRDCMRIGYTSLY